jgi:hypothetical protein
VRTSIVIVTLTHLLVIYKYYGYKLSELKALNVTEEGTKVWS